MKNISMTALSLMGALAMSDSALAQTNSWNLSRDMMIDISQNPTAPTPPANGVWSFEENTTGVLGPIYDTSYTLLPTYTTPCNPTYYPTLNCWQNTTTALSLPVVGITSSAPMNFGSIYTLLQGMPFLHPENNSQAIVGWKSPISGTVKIQGRIAHINPQCGDGVKWRIKKAQTPTVSPLVNLTTPWQSIKAPGTSTVPSARTFNVSTTVNIGTKIYFVVDKNLNQDCDWTTLDVLINKM